MTKRYAAKRFAVSLMVLYTIIAIISFRSTGGFYELRAAIDRAEYVAVSLANEIRSAFVNTARDVRAGLEGR